MAAIPRHKVVEIIQPLKSGMTEPFQCRMSDDRIYAVKGRGAMAHGLLAEVCAASLGQAMGLPIPEFAIAEMPQWLIDSTIHPEAAYSIGAGVAFASHWQDFCEPITPSIRDNQPPEFLATLYAFDHWIANGDRTLGEETGNPNILYRLEDKTLVAFDHNLAFSAGHHVDELAYHAGRRSWATVGRSNIFIPRLMEKMARARHEFNGFEAHLPDEWTEQLPDFFALACATLDRYLTGKFWTELG